MERERTWKEKRKAAYLRTHAACALKSAGAASSGAASSSDAATSLTREEASVKLQAHTRGFLARRKRDQDATIRASLVQARLKRRADIQRQFSKRMAVRALAAAPALPPSPGAPSLIACREEWWRE
jgi:hypothetical protein